MPDASVLTAEITALEGAFNRHELEVEFADRRVRYASFSEIKSRIDYKRQQLAALTTRPRQYQVVTGRGLS